MSDDDTVALHSNPCPGCGFEPEVIHYWVEKKSRKRVGYTCTCGARVIYGVVEFLGDR